jgi:hypothetical protein
VLQNLDGKHCSCHAIGKWDPTIFINRQRAPIANVSAAIVDRQITHHLRVGHVAAAKIDHQ